MNNLKYSNGSATYVESLEKKIAELEKQIVAIDMNNEPVAWLLFSDGNENYPQYTKSYKQMREWETYLGDNQRIEPHYTHPVKELTDFEIMQISAGYPDRLYFAREILRKAQQ